ncbi:hypothetical protein MYK68_06990 [Gordonia sp. PP30]|uniref:hypothetical protein n=1 Tax=unclassified Gordonia (in: high G+C Gram-positive bacteria) TaxID=2657482 RepID=UPI001FFF887A|nr:MULTISPECIES: hypothetical protein [unclassified Gordonia (in: high G+C Gram-positive bacteria)]UQE76320.1 hypothetical protein MYK68_06990 [Gordonia sp. PP30]
MSDVSIAEQLLDAQVRWALGRLTGDEVTEVTTRLVDDVLAAAEKTTVGELVDPAQVKSLVRLLAARLPASSAATTLAESGASIVVGNPAGEYTLRELIDRDNIERLTDETLALTPALERALDELTSSPLVASLASRFVGRIVNDVLAGNRAVAEKIPGVGSLVNLGTSVAGKAIGKTGEQFEQFFGDTAAKGAEFAMSRLNKIIIATLNDPQTRTAVLEVFDLYADRPVRRHDTVLSPDDALRVAGLAQDVVIAAATSRPVIALAEAFVDGFFDTYAGHPAAVLIEDIDLTRDDLVGYAVQMAPRLLAASAANGELERIVREQLAPFYASPEVTAILAG